MFYSTFKPEAGGASPEECHLGSTKFDQLKGSWFPDCQPKKTWSIIYSCINHISTHGYQPVLTLLGVPELRQHNFSNAGPFYRVSRSFSHHGRPFLQQSLTFNAEGAKRVDDAQLSWSPSVFFLRCFHTVDVLDCLFLVEWRLDFHVFFCFLSLFPSSLFSSNTKQKQTCTNNKSAWWWRNNMIWLGGWEVILIKRQCLFVSYHPGQTGCGHLPVAGSGKIIFPDQKRAPQWVFRKERNIPLKI